MPVKKLKGYLDEHGVRYVLISHSPAFTAQEIAAAAHIPGIELAKTVMVKLDGEMALTVLPASHRIEFDLLRGATGSEAVELATEEEFRDRFPDCEVGAMPPFGNLYGMRTFVAEGLIDDEQIAFNAGSHTELIRLPYDDFRRLAEPVVLRFSKPVA
jgi:Ala-tRNA(Pro) deacylase